MQYFFDTSAVVKVYHKETGSDKRLTALVKGRGTPVLELGI